jgi:peptide/nickel transport system permease protein
VLRYLVARVATLLLVLLGVSVLSFGLIYLVPGNAVDMLLAGETQVSPERRAEIERLLGLDRPPHVQYLRWMTGFIQGDLGTSIRTGITVRRELALRLPVTLELALLATLLAVVVAIPAGIISAVERNRWPDSTLKVTGLFGLSMPQFGLATLLLLLTSKYLPALTPGAYEPFSRAPLEHLRSMLLPALSAGAPVAAVIMRMTRSSMLDVCGERFVSTARAKGLGEWVVIAKHALRNALVPIVTIIGIQFGLLLSGVVIIEYIFTLPGLGTLMLNGIYQRDYPVVQSCIVVVAVLFVLVNLLVDVAYGWLDPRIRHA